MDKQFKAIPRVKLEKLSSEEQKQYLELLNEDRMKNTNLVLEALNVGVLADNNCDTYKRSKRLELQMKIMRARTKLAALNQQKERLLSQKNVLVERKYKFLTNDKLAKLSLKELKEYRKLQKEARIKNEGLVLRGLNKGSSKSKL
jgi:hypothetical protein